jgi:two-component system response regulator NreC
VVRVAVNPKPIRVVLADDHALMRHSLRLLLDADEGVDVVAEASNLVAVMCEVRARRPRVLVIDLSMSNGSSIDVVRRIRTDVAETEIVVLSMEESRVFAQAALDAGAIGFVLKQAADTELLAAVTAAARGARYVRPELAARLESLRRSRSLP